MGKTIRILLVDDHAILRDMLGAHLQKDPAFEVVGMGSDGTEAVALARDCTPDVVVLDIDMPGQSCFDAALRIRGMLPDVRLIFLSAHNKDGYIEQAMKVEANGYLSKEESPETVVKAIRDVAGGQAAFSQSVMNRLVIDNDRMRLADTHSKISGLTRRETEVLGYIAQGHSKKEIGTLMHIHTKTVEKHTENVMKKLGIHDRVQLTRFAIREGLAEA